MTCAEARALLDAHVDDELGGSDALVLERHLAECADCARALAARHALRASLASASLRHGLPDATAARLRDALGAGATARASAPSPLPLSRPAPAGWRRLAVAAAVAAIAVGAFIFGRLSTPPPEPALADAAVSSHVRSLLGGHPEDVLSSDHHTVKPWFTGKLDFAPEVVDLAPAGYRLTGGRLDDVGGRRVAALVYHAGAHSISLFTWPRSGDGCAEPGAAEERRGFRVLEWSCHGMAYVAVSDAAEPTLRTFARDLDAAAVE